MTVAVVVGAQWGDEGKGKITDFLAAQADMVIRCQGGANAGHTVVSEGVTYKLHLIPSGILYSGASCIISNGVVVDLGVLLQELDNLAAQGVDTNHLQISKRAHLIMPYHYRMDEMQEIQKGDAKIGTTKRGIGPAYVDKVARNGIRLEDLFDEASFRSKVEYNLREKNPQFVANGLPECDAEEIIAMFRDYAARIEPYVADTLYPINQAVLQGQKVLVEGAQGTLLDIDHGTYPFVTSSHPSAGGACTGAGIGPTKIDKVVGIAKAYATRVGSGPFPTELTDEMGDRLRQKGFEFGVTTGRARRCGWFDGVVARYSVLVNGMTDMVVTKLDVLDDQEEIKICYAYEYEGKQIDEFPSSLAVLEKCQPVYETLPGWCCDTTGCRSFEELPENAKKYLKRLEEISGVQVSIVAVGPDRQETIVRHPIF